MKAYYIYIIGIILCISSCKNHSQEWEKLQDVETYIETNADSALVTLQNIQPENLANVSLLSFARFLSILKVASLTSNFCL